MKFILQALQLKDFARNSKLLNTMSLRHLSQQPYVLTLVIINYNHDNHYERPSSQYATLK